MKNHTAFWHEPTVASTLEVGGRWGQNQGVSLRRTQENAGTAGPWDSHSDLR